MSSFLNIFPLYLVLLTAIFVIFPTFIAAILRHSLYLYLIDSANKVSRLLSSEESRGKQPKIVNKLETRFRQASERLENVNTIALIDGLYSQERLSFLGVSLRCEQWDYFCQTLPNLLLGFGLLGTFFGISYNLYNLSQTLNQNGEEINNLVEQLQIPLQNMGVAFFSSLTAIFCSSILIIINLRCNTNFAKALLISSLEDYLDNIFKVNIKGYSRMDRAVDRMVLQQQEFLTRFRENVQEVLEASFGKAANQIVTDNKNFQNNVDSLVSRFNDISSTMAKSTDGFQEAVFNLQQQIDTVNEIIPQFEASSNKLERSAERHLQASYRIEQSKFSEHLEKLTSDLATTQQSFSQSTSFLANQVNQLVVNNQEVTNLAQEIYTQLQKASTTIQDSAVIFSKAAAAFKETDFADKISSATQELITIPEQFKESTVTLHQSTKDISAAINNISNSANQITSLVEKVNTLNKYSSKLLQLGDRKLETQTTEFNNIQSELKQIVEKLQKHQEAINNGLENFGGRVLTCFQENSNNNIQELQSLTQQLNSGLNEFQVGCYRLLSSFEHRSTNNTQELQKLIKELQQLI
ncbi:MAG: methyl-accepting chemotaxis protein [Xenococcaceae cyanobacterium MO_207.B15]|nr:methyl-accepting chemotaxis protein [Xenococcaceae cyanobacterium MO_207.B15]